MADSEPEGRLSADEEREITAWVVDNGDTIADLPVRWVSDMLGELGALRSTIDDLTAERDRAERVRQRLAHDVKLLAAQIAADRLVIERAAADTPKLQAAQAWVDARRERDRLLSMVRNKRTRREFFRGAEALDVAEEALAAAFTEEPEGREV